MPVIRWQECSKDGEERQGLGGSIHGGGSRLAWVFLKEKTDRLDLLGVGFHELCT